MTALKTQMLGLELIIGIVGTVIEVLSAIPLLINLEYFSYASIDTGCLPGKAESAVQCPGNLNYFASMSSLILAIISLYLGAAEIGLNFIKKFFPIVDVGLTRGVIYIVKSIALLGVRGDFGIACCVFEMIFGIFRIVYHYIGNKSKSDY